MNKNRVIHIKNRFIYLKTRIFILNPCKKRVIEALKLN